MQRTQIYLDEEESTLLSRESARTGASRSELIRRAVRSAYGCDSVDQRIAALQASQGLWRGRVTTGAEYVDQVREDSLERGDSPGRR